MKNNDYSKVTVGIYTCFGGSSLVSAVKSIREAEGGNKVEVVIFADGNPMSDEVKEGLKKLDAKITERKGLSSQISKIKNIASVAEGDILILTQDDVIFDKEAVAEIVNVFGINSEVSMVGSRIVPVEARSFFESVLEIGVELVQKIGMKWRNGDNYLLSNGRCLSFRTESIRKFSFPEKLMNSDAYFYFENKKLGGKFGFAENSVVYNRSPLTLSEHFNQSSRFQTSEKELMGYFERELIEGEYDAPGGVISSEALKILSRHPIRGFSYSMVSLYTRLKPRKSKEVVNPIWKVDESTKRS